MNGNTAIVIGSETVEPIADANRTDAGKTVHRRFTQVWLRRDGRWEKVVRHASKVSEQRKFACDTVGNDSMKTTTTFNRRQFLKQMLAVSATFGLTAACHRLELNRGTRTSAQPRPDNQKC